MKKYIGVAIILATGLLSILSGCGGSDSSSSSGTIITKMSLWQGSTQLRGANIIFVEIISSLDGDTFGTDTVGPPVTQEDMTELAALGANFVNLSYPGIFNVDAPHALNTAIQSHLDSVLALIEKADMFAVISFRTGPGRSRFSMQWGEDTTSDPDDGWFPASYHNETIWDNNAAGNTAREQYIAMWKHTAERYKNSKVVVGYDLMVEPNSNETKMDVWDPDEFYGTYANSSFDWNALYPRVIDAVREVDADTPILVQSMAYADVEWLPYLTVDSDPKVVYTVHPYGPVPFTHTWSATTPTYPGTFDADWDNQNDTVNASWIANYLSDASSFQTSKGVAVAANEYGGVRFAVGMDRYLTDILGVFEANGWNHAIWAFTPAHTRENREVDETHFDFRFGTDMNNSTPVGNDMKTVVTGNWTKNTKRPSNTPF